MTAELVVMTAEKDGDKFKVYRTPVNDLACIPRTGTLFMAVSCEDTVKPRLNGRRRLCQSCGHDWYTLIVRRNHIMLAGWDTGDFEWKRMYDCWDEAATIRPDHLPLAAGETFKGIGISPEEWQTALQQINELH